MRLTIYPTTTVLAIGILSAICIEPLSCAAADDSPDDLKLREPQLILDIEQVKTTLPLPGVKEYPLPHPGVRTDTRTGMTTNGDIYAGCPGYLWKSTDRGTSWTLGKMPAGGGGGGFGILAGDVFILAYDAPASGVQQNTFVIRSTDFGETWSEPFRLDISPYDFSGAGWCHVYQHPDGTAMMTVTLRHRDRCFEEWDNPRVRGIRDHIFRSGDGGKTWGDRTLLTFHSAETSILALSNSQKMLAFVRSQRDFLAHDPPDLEEKTGAEKGRGWPVKNGVIGESHDGGRTWQNLRLFDTLGSVPGEIVQSPEGTVAVVWLQRYPHDKAEIRVRTTPDQGRTWSKTSYRLMLGTGYPSSVVYPDGTIVTVCENTKMEPNAKIIGKRTLTAAVWKMPDS